MKTMSELGNGPMQSHLDGLEVSLNVQLWLLLEPGDGQVATNIESE